MEHTFPFRIFVVQTLVRPGGSQPSPPLHRLRRVAMVASISPRRHSENSSNFIDLELSCFEELRLFRGNGNGRVLHTLFQYGKLF